MRQMGHRKPKTGRTPPVFPKGGRSSGFLVGRLSTIHIITPNIVSNERILLANNLPYVTCITSHNPMPPPSSSSGGKNRSSEGVGSSLVLTDSVAINSHADLHDLHDLPD